MLICQNFLAWGFSLWKKLGKLKGMAIIIVKDTLLEKDFQKAKKDYESYIKLTIDVKRQIVALGGGVSF